MKNLTLWLFSVAVLCIANFSQAQTVTLSDAFFEQFLINNSFDSNPTPDGVISQSDANAVTVLSIPASAGVTNLTGITSFNNLLQLIVSNNPISIIDVNNLSKLHLLQFNNCGTVSLNTNGCNKLWSINGNNNPLATIDVSTNSKLYSIKLGYNMLTSLDVFRAF